MTRLSFALVFCFLGSLACSSTSVRSPEQAPSAVAAPEPPRAVAAADVAPSVAIAPAAAVATPPLPKADSEVVDSEVVAAFRATAELATLDTSKHHADRPASDCLRPPTRECCRAMTPRCMACRRGAARELAAWEAVCRPEAPADCDDAAETHCAVPRP